MGYVTVNSELLIIPIVVLLVLLSGLFSGLTLGLFSLSNTALERKIELGDKDAAHVYSVRRDGNLLLCTLLLGNTAVNAALSIFLGSLAGGVIAGVISTGLIVVFGEILPQAICSRHPLAIGSRSVWIVKIFRALFYVVARPISWLLDKMLGQELPTIYTREELEIIVEQHEDEGPLDADEERIIKGALHFSARHARDVMTSRASTFVLDHETMVTPKLLAEIQSSGRSRIPVIDGDEVVGILYAKDLLTVRYETPISTIWRTRKLASVREDTPLDDIFTRLTETRVHIAVVIDGTSQFSGIITLEDILEQIVRRPIFDEHDSTPIET